MSFPRKVAGSGFEPRSGCKAPALIHAFMTSTFLNFFWLSLGYVVFFKLSQISTFPMHLLKKIRVEVGLRS